MKAVLVIEVDVPDDFDLRALDTTTSFSQRPHTWSVYTVAEDNPPIRLNITHDGVEEV